MFLWNELIVFVGMWVGMRFAGIYRNKRWLSSLEQRLNKSSCGDEESHEDVLSLLLGNDVKRHCLMTVRFTEGTRVRNKMHSDCDHCCRIFSYSGQWTDVSSAMFGYSIEIVQVSRLASLRCRASYYISKTSTVYTNAKERTGGFQLHWLIEVRTQTGSSD